MTFLRPLCLSAQNSDIKEFEEGVCGDLEALLFEGRDEQQIRTDAETENAKTRRNKLLDLSWLSHVLSSALKNQMVAMQIVSPHQASGDEKCFENYMSQTKMTLDACNAISVRISDTGQGILLIRYVLHVLIEAGDGLNEEKATSMRKTLQDWLVTVEAPDPSELQGKTGMCSLTLQHMCNGLSPVASDGMTDPNSFFHALYGSNAIMFLAFFALALAFSPERLLLTINPQFFDHASWSPTMSCLLDCLKFDASQPILEGFKLCLWDFLYLRREVAALLNLLDFTTPESVMASEKGQLEVLATHIRGMCLMVDDFSKNLDCLGTKLNDVFHAVVRSRSVLLDKIGKNTCV